MRLLDDFRAAWQAVRSRPRQNQIRTFEAANVNRLTFDWAYSVLSFDQQLQMYAAIPRLRARSRELAQNDPSMARFIRKMEKSVVGPSGMSLQGRIRKKRKRGESDLDEDSNDLIESSWALWSKKKFASLDQRLSWRGIQKLTVRTAVTDGEVLIRRQFVSPAENPFGVTLQMIDSDQLDWQYGSSIPVQLSNGNTVRFGVERDDRGRHAAYWVYKQHPSEIGFNSMQRIRIPADELLHIIVPIKIGQSRGIPWATAALSRMNTLKGYIDAEVVAARLAACQMGSIETELPKEYPDGDPTNPGRKLANNGESIEAQPGAFIPLLPGDKLNPIKWDHPTAAFESFVRGVKLDIAAAMDITYMSLTGDLTNANFSSARVGLLDERDTWEELQQWLIEELCEPVYDWWLDAAMLSPRSPLSALKSNDPMDYQDVIWHARSFPWIDPLKDGQAAVLKVENAFSTRTKELAQQGMDFTEVCEELKEEQDLIEKLGLKLGSDIRGTANSPDATANEGDGSQTGSQNSQN